MLTQEAIQELKQAHRVLADWSYIVPKVQRGYAGLTSRQPIGQYH
jgi:hypothetical protein